MSCPPREGALSTASCETTDSSAANQWSRKEPRSSGEKAAASLSEMPSRLFGAGWFKWPSNRACSESRKPSVPAGGCGCARRSERKDATRRTDSAVRSTRSATSCGRDAAGAGRAAYGRLGGEQCDGGDGIGARAERAAGSLQTDGGEAVPAGRRAVGHLGDECQSGGGELDPQRAER